MTHQQRNTATQLLTSKIKTTRLYRPLLDARQRLRRVRLWFKELWENAKWHVGLKPSGFYVASLQQSPGSLETWISLAGALRRENTLDCDMVGLLKNHKILGPNSTAMRYEDELSKTLTADLRHAAGILTQTNKRDIAIEVMQKLVAKKTILQCRDAHTVGGYYADAEPYMDRQWDKIIYPLIRGHDFSTVLELAPGHGRNTEKLRHLAKAIHLVDVNATCIEACRTRFGIEKDGCEFFYYVNDGNFLSAIKSASISFIYSFDSMVHFDKLVVKDYLGEFKRVMLPNAVGFVHHSNYGAIRPNSDWATNYGTRSDMSAKLFSGYCEEIGLRVVSQRLLGLQDWIGMEGLDCISIFRKPS